MSLAQNKKSIPIALGMVQNINILGSIFSLSTFITDDFLFPFLSLT